MPKCALGFRNSRHADEIKLGKILELDNTVAVDMLLRALRLVGDVPTNSTPCAAHITQILLFAQCFLRMCMLERSLLCS